MFDVMAEWMTVPLLNHEAGQSPGRVGLSHPSIAPYGVFACADGRGVLISVQSDREWQRLAAEFLGDPHLGTDPDFATNVARVQNRDRTDGIVREAFAKQGAAAAIEALTQADIAFAEVNDLDALSRHPCLSRQDVATANGPVSLPGPAPRFDGAARDLGKVPDLGQGPAPQTPEGS